MSRPVQEVLGVNGATGVRTVLLVLLALFVGIAAFHQVRLVPRPCTLIVERGFTGAPSRGGALMHLP